MVPEGRRHATSDVWTFGKAALRPVSLICGAGGDRAPSRAGQYHTGGRSPARVGSIDNLPGVAAQRRHPKRRPRVSRNDSAMARRAGRSSKLALNAALQAYVEERLAGVVVAPNGVPVP